MKILELPYSKDLDFEEIKKLISFISIDIQNYQITDGSIRLFIADECDEKLIKAKYDRLINRFGNPRLADSYYHQNSKGNFNAIDLKLLEDSGFIKKYGDGLIGLGPDSIPVFNFFSSIFRNFAMEEKAEERMYPTLLDAKAYRKTGYFKSSPQYATFCCDVIEDIDCIEKLCDEYDNGTIQNVLNTPKFALSPSACFHTYLEYENSELESNRMITFEQKVFRNEGRFNWEELGRLRDYHVREIVFIGSDDYVKQNRQKMMKKTAEFLEETGIIDSIVSSSDPFIVPQMQPYKKLQVHQKSKYEAKIKINEDSDLACASFNLHGVSFTKPFHIKVKHIDYPVTGCVGFGLERWVLAFLCQHGINKKNWPKLENLKGAKYD